MNSLLVSNYPTMLLSVQTLINRLESRTKNAGTIDLITVLFVNIQ